MQIKTREQDLQIKGDDSVKTENKNITGCTEQNNKRDYKIRNEEEMKKIELNTKQQCEHCAGEYK